MKKIIFLVLGVGAFQGLAGMDRVHLVRQLHKPHTGSCPDFTDVGRGGARKRRLSNAPVLRRVEYFLEGQRARFERLRGASSDDSMIDDFSMEELESLKKEATEK